MQAEILKNIFFNSTPEGQNSDSLAQATRCLRCAGLGIGTGLTQINHKTNPRPQG